MLAELNSRGSLDISNELFRNVDPDDCNPYMNITIDSTFEDLNTFVSKFQNSNKPLFLNLNVQAINSKFENLKQLIVNITNKGIQIDVIAIQETWGVKYPKLLIIPGFQEIIYANRKKGKGGGVGFYIRNGINCTILNSNVGFTDKLFESLTVKLTYSCDSRAKSVIVSNVYRSPTPVTGLTTSQQYDIFNDKLESLMHELSICKVDSYIFLDSNINLLKKDDISMQYINTFHDKGFLLTNMKATRMTGTSSSLIDNILTNSKMDTFVSGSLIEDISDHWITFVQPNISKSKTKPKNVKKRLINKENLEKFKNNLNSLNWDEVMQSTDVDDCYDKFWSLFSTLYDSHFPWVTVKFNRNVHKISEFMTKGLLVSRRTKLELLKMSLSEPSIANKAKYVQYRNLFNTLIRSSKKIHIDSKLKNDAKNPKKVWDTLKELTTGKMVKKTINSIETKEGVIITQPTAMAEEFNKFFASAGKNVHDSVIPTVKKPEEYLPVLQNPPPEMTIKEIAQGELINIISAMDPKTSNDINGISTKLIKSLKHEISTPLTHLFNLSIRTGKFPSKLKISKTIPVHKSGSCTSCDNYRPISLLSSISKILEKFVANQLVNHLEYNKLIYHHQYGFQRNKSTVHNLLNLANFVAKEINEKKLVVGVFLDLKKAFDVVDHDILLKKLEYLGIRGDSLKWFASYLEGRTQLVEIDGELSSSRKLDISIFQGSILGPILFICFINDIHTVTNLLTLLFADDTAALKSGFDIKQVIDDVNVELNKLANWLRANRMACNVNKTKYIIFKPKGVNVTLNVNEGVKYDDNEIGQPYDNDKVIYLDRIHNDNDNVSDRSYKLLGLYLDEHLSFNQHCNHIRTKIAQSNFIINRAKHLLPQSALKTLYYALVHPHLIYCLPIYACTTSNNITMLEKMQKKVIRTISHAKYNDHTSPLFKALSIMPLKHLIKYQQSLLMHSIYHKYSPPSLHSTWMTNSNRQNDHDHELRNADELYIPLARTEQVRRLPYIALPTMWNDLYVQKYTPNPLTFKIAIKDYFLNIQQE